MTRLRFGLAFVAFAIVVPVALADNKKEDKKAVNVAGNWSWTVKRQDQEFTQTLKLKQDGDKVTGTISGREGTDDIEIKEAKLDGAEFSFQVVREFNGNSFTIKYKGKVEGDTIKGKRAMERDGETRESDWEAKRADKKA